MNIIDKITKLREIIQNLDESSLDFTPFNPTIDKEQLQSHLKRGKWSLLHLSAPENSLGSKVLRIIPWKSSNSWHIGNTNSVSMESWFEFESMEAYLKGGALQSIVNVPEYCSMYKKEWSKYEKLRQSMSDIFEIPESTAILKQWLFDEKNWPSKEINHVEKAQRLKNISLIVNPSEENNLLWTLVKNYSDDSFLPEVPNIQLSLHEERILSSMADRAATRAYEETFDNLEPLLFQSVLYTHGFGAETHDLKGLPSPSSTSLRTKAALEVLFDPYVRNDFDFETKGKPEFYLAKKLHESRGDYTGTPHVELAAEMDETLNEPKKAWKYLLSAGYWAGKNFPEAQPAVLNAAIFLCQKHGWEEAGEVLEYNKQLMND